MNILYSLGLRLFDNEHGNLLEDPLLTPHQEYLAIAKTVKGRQKLYCDLFNASTTGCELDNIGENTNKNLPAGSKRYKERVEAALGRKVGTGKRGQPTQIIGG